MIRVLFLLLISTQVFAGPPQAKKELCCFDTRGGTVCSALLETNDNKRFRPYNQCVVYSPSFNPIYIGYIRK